MDDIWQYVAFFALSVFGSAMQSAVGFGYGVLAMSVMPFVVPYRDALCAVGIIAVYMAIVIAFKHRRALDIKILVAPLVSAFVISTLGTVVVKTQPDAVLLCALGVALIALSIWMAFVGKNIRIKPSVHAGAISGSAAGAMASLFGMGGPPIAIYFIAACGSPETYIACTQVYFLVTNFYTSCVRAVGGLITTNAVICAVAGIIGTAIGANFGTAIFRRMTPRALRLCICAVMAASGATLLIRS